MNNANLVISEKSELMDRVTNYQECASVPKDKSFDDSTFWIFGSGLDAFSQYPYFQEESRAKEICEDGILYRFLYCESDPRADVMSEDVFINVSNCSGETKSVDQTPHGRSLQRMSKFNISDEMFFQLPLCLGFLPALKKYVEVRNFNKGDRIFSDTEKRKSDCFFIIRQGLLEYREVRDMTSCQPGRRLAVLGAGHVTRAGSFLSHMGHLADYVAVVDATILWSISRDAMQRISDEDPTLLSMIFSSLGLSCARQNHVVSGVRYGDSRQGASYVGLEYFQLHPPASEFPIRGVSFA